MSTLPFLTGISQRLTYIVTTIVATAFSGILIFLAWRDAIDREQARFSIHAESLKGNAAKGFAAAHDMVNQMATLFSAVDKVDSETFLRFTNFMLNSYPFVHSAAFHPINLETTGSRVTQRDCSIPVRYLASRDQSAGTQTSVDLCSDPRIREAVDTAISYGVTVPSPSGIHSGVQHLYLLLRAVYEPGTRIPLQTSDKSLHQKVRGVAVLVVAPEILLQQSTFQSPLALLLYSESIGITGRQLIYSKDNDADRQRSGWTINNLQEESLSEFPRYAMRLQLRREILWNDIDKGIFYTALTLSLGTTLLLFALARAKENQASQLQRRNQEIEQQVKEQLKELSRARDHALDASRVKSEFLASMSHEIRTPLNAIIGMADLLAETALTSDQRKYVDIFRKAGEALQSLVNDILDFSKIEAGQLMLENLKFDLRELIDQTLDIHAVQADEKGLELLCHVSPEVPSYVVGDPTRLRQILLNLIGNAIKFTESGEILLRTRVDSGSKKPDVILFTVEDTGIGIPQHKLKEIFESFSQVDSSTTRRYGGTGLGLAICKRLVELMGGSIWAESRIGRGSSFTFDVCLPPAEAIESRTRAPAIDISGTRVLVIDDNTTNRLIVRQMLTQHGALVTEASSGPAALIELSQASNARTDFDLVLTDCRMPDMDGFEVAQAMHAMRGDLKTVLMLTSSNLGDDLQRARNLGIGAYLVKPVKWPELAKAMSRALSSNVLDRTMPIHVATAEAPKDDAITILLVEDNVDNRVLIQAFLKSTPYHVDEATNGQEAFEKFTKRNYRLVLMDVQMPIMDGHAATGAIREYENRTGREPTPIIALTAHATREDMERSMAAGCTSHLSKPIKKGVLLQTVERYLTQAQIFEHTHPNK